MSKVYPYVEVDLDKWAPFEGCFCIRMSKHSTISGFKTEEAALNFLRSIKK